MTVNDYQENYGSGWIKLHRSIKNHWLFSNDKFFKWWVTLLIEVNHKDNKIQLGYDLYEIKRGQSAKSLRNWATLLNCNVKQFVKFLDLLEKDDMISRKILGKGKQSTTLVNINNYSQYQGGIETQVTTQVTTQEGTQGKRNRGTNNNDNKEKNEKECKEETPTHILEFERIRNNIELSDSWITLIAKQKKSTVTIVKANLKEFLDDIMLKEDWKDEAEMKKHFVSWFNIKNPKQDKPQTYKNPTDGAKYYR